VNVQNEACHLAEQPHLANQVLISLLVEGLHGDDS